MSKIRFLVILLSLSATSLRLLSQIQINEILASNYSVNADPDYSKYSDWVELINKGASSVDLTGYYLSDTYNDTTKWSLPSGTVIEAGGYLLIWADGANTGLHTNFKLNSNGEKMSLYNSQQELLDSLRYPQQRPDVSYGRNASGDWKYFSEPTPAAANTTTAVDGASYQPVFSIPGGYYSGSQNLSLSYPVGTASIYYTVDGSAPTKSSTLYANPISITSPTVVRAIAFENDKLPSFVINNTYLIDVVKHTIPVFSISIDQKDFDDPSTGFYTNYDEEWEKPIGIEFYEADGTQGFSANGGISVYGGATRGAAQKAFGINFSSQYGQKDIKYPLFPWTERRNYGSFLLRNGGNNWYSSTTFNPGFFCDGIQHSIFEGKMDLDLMPCRPSAVYINGEYWGILNLREKLNEEYMEAYFGVPKDSVDFIKLRKKTPNEVLSGDSTDFYNLIQYVKTNDISQKTHFDYVCSKIDLQEFINYNIAEMYTANFDWPDNNNKFWKPQADDGKWRWMLYDLDFGFSGQAWGGGSPKWSNYRRDFFQDAMNASFNEWSTLIFIKLMENEEFQQLFFSTLAYHCNSTFQHTRVYEIIDYYRNDLETEMQRHIDKWGLEGGISSSSEFKTAMSRLKTFAFNRLEYIWLHSTNYIDEIPVALQISQNSPTGGYLLMDDTHKITEAQIDGKFYTNMPIKLKAQTYPGYLFKGFSVARNNVSDSLLIEKGSLWKYLDNGSDQGTAWKETGFDDSSWKSGNAQFGYGEDDEVTVLSYGPDKTDKYITYYFRSSFELENIAQYDFIRFQMLYDDGVVIYINGEEVLKENISGIVDYQTTAQSDIGSGHEGMYKLFDIETKFANLVSGTNTIAVEIHQREPDNSDVSFDLRLLALEPIEYDSIFTTADSVVLSLSGDARVYVEYEKLVNLFINEIGANNYNYYKDEQNQFDDWIEIYNAGDTPIDMAGLYITDNLNNPNKWRIKSGEPLKTTVPAKGFLTLWADGDTINGANHLNFGLSSGGESVGIFDFSGSLMAVIDTMTYDSAYLNKSYGRYPDGAMHVQHFDLATPLAPNNDTIIVITNIEYEPVPLSAENDYIVYPNPSSQFIFIESKSMEGLNKAKVSLTNISGKQLLQQELNDKNQIDVSYLPAGIYILAIEHDQHLESYKIIIE